MTDEQKLLALQERALELTVEYAPKHEYTEPDDGTRCFSALGFARDLVQAISEETVEVLHRDRKVTIYADSVLRVWGPDIEEMSNAPRSFQTVQDALDWLYEEEPESLENTEQEPNAWRDPTNGDPGQAVTFQKGVAEKWPHIFSMPLFAKPQANKATKFYAPKGWRLMPEKMSAAMINAWSGGPTVSSDEVAYRTSWQEAWKRVVDAAMNLECVECYDTGYVADGNHCIACSVPADPNIEELFQRQQAGFERCYEALGITDDRERSWSSLVLSIYEATQKKSPDFESEAAHENFQRDYMLSLIHI